MTTPDVLDGAEIEKIVAGMSEQQLDHFRLGTWNVGDMPATMVALGLAKRVPVCMLELTEAGRQVAHLARTRRVVDARSHGGEG